jgi:hypothetical protein
MIKKRQMSKIKITLAFLTAAVVIAGIYGATQIQQKKIVSKLTASVLTKKHDKETPVHSVKLINQKIDLFHKKPSLQTLADVENSIGQKFRNLSMDQRYKLLDRFQIVLATRYYRLDPLQDDLLSIYAHIEVPQSKGELLRDLQKKKDANFISKLNPEQKSLLRQLNNHSIEITPNEEYGAIYHVKPNYWNRLFGAYFSKSDQLYWNQLVLENDPFINRQSQLAVNRVTLGDWAFFWEQFIKDNPDSHFHMGAENHYQRYINHMLEGTGNSPTIDRDTKKINLKVEKDFDMILKRHPNSDVAKSITFFRKSIHESQNKVDTSTVNKDDFMMQ